MSISNVSRADLLYLLAATKPERHTEVACHCGYERVDDAAAEKTAQEKCGTPLEAYAAILDPDNSATQEERDTSLAAVLALDHKTVTRFTKYHTFMGWHTYPIGRGAHAIAKALEDAGAAPNTLYWGRR